MKLQLLFVVVLFTFALFSHCKSSVQNPVLVQLGINDELQGHFILCIQDTIDEYYQFRQLVQDVRDHKWMGAFEELVDIIQRTQDLMTNCKGIYCFGTGYKSCISDNTGKFCELWGLLLYPQCASGYVNWDCCICATQCPDGFGDTGLYCTKPSAYGRGAGYPLWQKDKCNQEHQDVGGCEKNGALYYPKCKANYHNVGCCVCSPNCPDGWSDIGVSCKKPQQYGRGTGYSVLFNCGKNNDHLIIPTIPDDTCDNQAPKIDDLLSHLDSEVSKGQQDPTYQEDPNLYDIVKEIGERAKKYQKECQ